MVVGEKRTRTLLFVIDTTNSMINDIDAINYAFEKSISIVRVIQEKYPDLLFLINVLEFYEEAEWQMPFPGVIDHYEWHNLSVYGVSSDFAKICKELNERLSDDVFMRDSNDSAIILLVDSPLDGNYNEELEKLTGEPRFRQAIKKTIVYGEYLRDTDLNALEKFSGGKMNATPRKLKELCKQILGAVTEAALFGLNLDEGFIMQLLNKEKEECDRKYPIKVFRVER